MLKTLKTASKSAKGITLIDSTIGEFASFHARLTQGKQHLLEAVEETEQATTKARDRLDRVMDRAQAAYRAIALRNHNRKVEHLAKVAEADALIAHFEAILPKKAA